jgi:ATP-binding cassette subfamily C protein CydC
MPAAMLLMPGAREAVRRIRVLADAPLPVPEPERPVSVPTGTEIVLQEVSFAYGPSHPVLERFNLTIPAGARVALTGPSGCGKSTLADLLLRFRSYEGSIAIGGVELRDLAADDLQRLIAAMPQQPHLFNGTIRENILLARPEAAEDDLDQVLADVALTDWVTGLPEGLATRVGEGGSAVSGGEARRIALARALLKEAPIIILDEPTEGLDLATERKVVDRLHERLKGKTVLIITHRSACLALAGRVVWMTPPTATSAARS